MKTLLSLSLVVCAAFAQYPPGGYPPGGYPPGTYPPGTYPGQQGGIGIPRRSKSASTTQKTDDYQVIRGVVRSIDDKSMEVGADDERIVTLQINDKTKKPDKLIPGDKVEIDATQDDKGAFVATEIRKTGSGPPPVVVAAPTPSVDGSASAKADKPAPEPADDTRPTTVMATPAPSDPDDDSGPPTLKHGIPKPRKQQAASTPSAAPAKTEVAKAEIPAQPAPEPTTAPVPTKTPAQPTHEDVVAKAREASENFLEGLPNYVVQQFTTRYVSSGRKADWQAQDVVTSEVIWESGKERYEKLAINGKQVKKADVEAKGAYSYGEFGTVLDDLFSPATAADFKYRGSRSIEQKAAFIYDFEVDHPHSHWSVQVPGQRINPAYRGTVWIEKATSRVLRLEMQAVKIPTEFPQDTTEMAVDYDYTRIGDGNYLLPVKAEILGCERGSTTCERNVIEFRNYHKFEGESNIVFH